MLLHGDCLERLKEFPDNYFDAVVTDPPYGWRFMGKAWDGADIEKFAKAKERGGVMADGKIRKPRDLPAESAGTYDQTISGNKSFELWTAEWAKEAFRVLKPGGHALIFCGPRTYHRMASGVEDAGFEIRDQLQWLFGSGFPKSHNLKDDHKGWGTALKPANEPICLARKPLEKGLTVAENVLKWGTGAINVDASRIQSSPDDFAKRKAWTDKYANGQYTETGWKNTSSEGLKANAQQGRWPANVLFDETAAEMLDEQSGHLHPAGNKNNKPANQYDASSFHISYDNKADRTYKNDKGGGASRFFYVAKASKRERNAGLEGMPLTTKGHITSEEAYGPGTGWKKDAHKNPNLPRANHHPTVKPIKLMEYLCRLITPPNGIILDPFMGSGSTGVAAHNLGFGFVGCEMNEEYIEIARRRIEHVSLKENVRYDESK